MKIRFFAIMIFTSIHLGAQKNVGINVNIPEFNLDMRSTLPGIQNTLNLANSDNSNYLRLNSGDNTGNFPYLGWSETENLLFGTLNTSNNFKELMRLSDSGRLGLGTTKALGLLHLSLNSNANTPQLRLTEQEDDFTRIKFENIAYPSSSWNIASRSIDYASGSKINFSFSDDTSTRDVLSIVGSGLVGINQPFPDETLEVNGDVRMGGGNADYDLSSENIGIEAQSETWYIGVQNESTETASDFYIGQSTGEDGIFHVQHDGNVSIGTTNAYSKLTVNGRIQLGDDATSSRAGQIRWNATNKSFEGYTGTEWVVLGGAGVPKSKTIGMISFVTDALDQSELIRIFDYPTDNLAGARIYDPGSSATNKHIYIPIELEGNAIIDEIVVRFIDNHSTDNLSIKECYYDTAESCYPAVITSGSLPTLREITINNTSSMIPGKTRYLKINPVNVIGTSATWGLASFMIESVTVYYH